MKKERQAEETGYKDWWREERIQIEREQEKKWIGKEAVEQYE